MKRYALTLTLLLAIATIAVPTVQAEDEIAPGINHYLAVGFGSYLPTHRSSSQGTAIQAGYGIVPLPNLAFETNAGYMQQPEHDSLFMVVSLTETAKAIYPFGLGSVYALAGGGVYYTAYHFNGDHAGQTFPTEDDDTSLGYFFGAGADFFIRNSVTFGLEVKWLNLKSSYGKLRNTALNDFADRDYSGALIMGKLAFNF
jgi:opacity protein-like surface antigen